MSSQTLKAKLKNELKGLTRLAVLAVGSELRTDDAAGLMTARFFKAESKKVGSGIKLNIFFGETAPENLTGQIKRFKPSHLIIIDAMTFGQKPGAIRVVSSKEINSVSFSTHKIPVKLTVDYLRKFFPCEIIMIGIEPKSLAVLGSMTKEVSEAAKKLSRVLTETLICMSITKSKR